MLYSRASIESPTHPPIAGRFSLSPLFPFPLLSGRLSFLLCSSFPPSFDSDVFPYRRHFSFFRYYSGVISSFPPRSNMNGLLAFPEDYSPAPPPPVQLRFQVDWSLKMGPTGRAGMLANTYRHRQRNNAQEWRRFSVSLPRNLQF